MDGLGHIETLNNQQMVSMIIYVCDLFCYQIFTCDAILQVEIATDSFQFNPEQEA